MASFKGHERSEGEPFHRAATSATSFRALAAHSEQMAWIPQQAGLDCVFSPSSIPELTDINLAANHHVVAYDSA
jgi:hypothetical protein